MIAAEKLEKYTIEVSSDVDYEHLVSSIYIFDVFVALLWYDSEAKLINVDMMKDFGSSIDKVSIDIDTFLKALGEAKAELMRSVGVV